MNTTTRAIRIPDEAWNTLEQRANEHKLRGRAEYIVYALDHPDTVERVVERVVEVPDPEILRALEAANAEITRLQNELEAVASSAIMENPDSTKKPVHRFAFASILKRWPEARRNRYNSLPKPPIEWINAVLETLYDMLDELGA